MLKWIGEISKPLFDFLKELCDCKWKKTVMFLFSLMIITIITLGTLYVFTLKYQAIAVPQYKKAEIIKPESILPDYIEYKDRTNFENKAIESK